MRFTLNGVRHELTADQVRHRLEGVEPEPVRRHGVRVDGRVYSIKQAFEAATGVPRSDFTSHIARSHLGALGFELVGVIESRVQRIDDRSLPSGSTTGTGSSRPHVEYEWYTEARTQAAVVAHLVRDGWTILSVADTASRERGIDVTAERASETVAIEVKGYPSERYADPARSDETKRTHPTNQAWHWYAQAILKAMITRSRRPEARSVVALPSFARYRDLHAETAGALESCRIEIWWVTADGAVTAVV